MGRWHGMSASPTYKSWQKMVERCTNPASIGYANYGGAGVTVHAEWTGHGGFERFLAHAGERPSRAHTIDRIVGTRGYEPGNVRWATAAEQARNRKSTILVTIGEETLCVADWCARSGLDKDTAYMRIKRGWDPAAAVTFPAVKNCRTPAGAKKAGSCST